MHRTVWLTEATTFPYTGHKWVKVDRIETSGDSNSLEMLQTTVGKRKKTRSRFQPMSIFTFLFLAVTSDNHVT
ncbi:Uncharacterized protein APZ42_013346 [Daphnia magna]|uniref:Uncharacterized protein n=1 Tax=Daphnia magna TaxID=35525 RepID=A0A0P5ZB23_9CRUS|nr:Uncharacterized protein APZ42_013346 [Daphnia magna]